MWPLLAMAGLKSIQDNQNNKQNIASNVITQKYSPWTGQRADFSAQGKNDTMSNFMSAYGAGKLQDSLNAQSASADIAKKAAQDKADGDFYEHWSASNPVEDGVAKSVVAGGMSKSSFAPSNTGRVPAVMTNANQTPSSSQDGLMGALNSENPWLTMANQPTQSRLPQGYDFHKPAQMYSPPGSQWFQSTPLGRSM